MSERIDRAHTRAHARDERQSRPADAGSSPPPRKKNRMAANRRIALAARLRNRWRVQRNQSSLLRLCRQSPAIYIRTEPPQGCAGKPDRFYHFVFDLVLPLYRIMLRAPTSARFTVGSLGPFATYFEQLFPGRVDVIPQRLQLKDAPPGLAAHSLIGMNPRCCYLYGGELRAFRRHVFDVLGCPPAPQPTQVLLIERLPPQPYYVEKGRSTSGAGRRSLLNHAEVLRHLESTLGRAGNVVNLQLENLTLREQIDYFRSARLVVAQHGAALANALWLPDAARVIEIGTDTRQDHFSTLCRVMGIQHHHLACAADQAHVDIEALEQCLLAAGMMSDER
ncbi:MAG: glycosyltransferase family 61 protein [Halioglobus sp.]